MHMPITHLAATCEPERDAATVVLLRDAAKGLEVFLMQRSGLSDSFGHAYVFPGGKLDHSDSSPTALAALDQPTHTLRQALAEPQLDAPLAAGLYVAALRELFEESGVLLTHSATRPTSNNTKHWHDWLAQSPRQLCASGLHPWSRWITPRVAALSKKRFDTRFFLAKLPQDQHAKHDNYETTDSIWLSPREALRRYEHGEMVMAPPQIMSLAQLCQYANVTQALRSAQNQTPPCICPESGTDQGENFLCYPGDPQHSIATRALSGPTRLILRNERFVLPADQHSYWA